MGDATGHCRKPLTVGTFSENGWLPPIPNGPTIRRLIRTYSAGLIEQWADITLAAKERHGEAFFSRSP